MPQSVSWDAENRAYHALIHGPQPPKYLFLHANGFSGGTYLPLLERLEPEAGWAAPDLRGHGRSFTPPRIRSWLEFVADVRAWASAGYFETPIVLGHSLGGMTALMTEALHPGTFRAIVLIDPVIFPPRFVVMMALLKALGLWRKNPLAKAARTRRMVFPSREAVLESYGRKRAFRTWEPGFLENYVKWGTVPADDGVRLACPGEIEAQIFSTWPLRFWLLVGKVACPVLILRGARSDTFWDDTARLLVRKLQHAEFHTVGDAGHFLPMEQPDRVIELIRTFAGKI